MIKVTDNLYRGPRPNSFAELQALGITDVINLQSGVHELLNDDEYEKQIATTFGIKEHNICCSDFTPPNLDQVIKFLVLVGEAKGVAYVHCLHGKDRTGFMCAVYRMREQAWSFEDAKKEMYLHGFHKFPYLWWVLKLRDYEVSR